MDVLDEAQDPRTPLERLRALHKLYTGLVLLNPSCPPDLLWEHLSKIRYVEKFHPGGQVRIWQNPTVAMLALVDPPRWEKAALDQLAFVTRANVAAMRRPKWGNKGLAHAVEWWRRRPDLGECEARRFARAMAALFGLPWKEPRTRKAKEAT